MLTFSMVYQYSEEFMLVLSHDEVVHMKGSMYTKMPGDRKEKFANLRLTYGYMAAHPGKKLLFMGQEFGQEREWSEERELDWELLEPVDGEMSDHERLRQYVSVLNSFYLAHPAMYAEDSREAGYEWMSTLDADHSVITFVRKCKEETLFVVCNFTPVEYENFRMGVPFAGKYKEIFNSNAAEFGGTTVGVRTEEKREVMIVQEGIYGTGGSELYQAAGPEGHGIYIFAGNWSACLFHRDENHKKIAQDGTSLDGKKGDGSRCDFFLSLSRKDCSICRADCNHSADSWFCCQFGGSHCGIRRAGDRSGIAGKSC